jgi:hypothetical protein
MTTLGLILPAALAVFALVDIAAFRFIHSQGSLSQRNYAIWGAAAIALPAITYLILNVFVPKWGAIEVL